MVQGVEARPVSPPEHIPAEPGESAAQTVWWPFALAIAVYSASTGWILLVGWHLCTGHLIYPLDDVYINMAVAKNFALHGVWGVSPFEFTSCTSSPLYVLLLSGVYRLTGVNLYAPLVLSSIFAAVGIVVAGRMLSQVLAPRWQSLVLLAFVLLTSMFTLGTLGMEHSLHLLLILLFLKSFQDRSKPLWLIGLLTALMVGSRYEGLLMAAVATLVLLAGRNWVRAGLVAVSAWIPVAIYGTFSVTHGGYWLPNSVAVKGVRVAGAAIAQRLASVWTTSGENWKKAPHLILLVVTLLVLAAAIRRRNPLLAGTLAVVGGAGLLHQFTADTGWAYRYEAYLVGSGFVVLGCAWPAIRQTPPVARWASGLLFCLTLLVLSIRAEQAFVRLPLYSQAIYRQQWQTARFLNTFDAGQAVAANDIGAIDYVTDLHCVDLGALASAEVFAAKREDRYTTGFLEQLAQRHEVKVAVIYESWFAVHSFTPLGGPPLPSTWVRVRRWSVPAKLQLGDRTVSFYVIDRAQAPILKAQLQAFEATLPAGVTAEP